jgi:hypothetical protein
MAKSAQSRSVHIELHIMQSRSGRTITLNVAEIESVTDDPMGPGGTGRVRTKSGETHLVTEGHMQIKQMMYSALEAT